MKKSQSFEFGSKICQRLGVLFLSFLFVFSLFNPFNSVQAQTSPEIKKFPEINFFHQTNCPHCKEEEKLLEKIQEKYPEIKINRYETRSAESRKILADLAKSYKVEKYMGNVPLTFIGQDFFLGYDNEENRGAQIIASLERQSGQELDLSSDPEKQPVNNDPADSSFSFPFIGKIDSNKFPLIGLAIALGLFDGFNICSLGALLLILSLVLSFRSRTKLAILGGIFILITALTYGILVFFWYKIFNWLVPISGVIEVLIALMGIFGGIIFIRQYIWQKKFGAQCKVKNWPIIEKVTEFLRSSFSGNKGVFYIILAIVVFSFLIAIIEFPCSATIPLWFSAILASKNLALFSSIFYMAVFMLFYLIDEIIIFIVGLVTMKIWVSSQKLSTSAILFQGILFLMVGLFYFYNLVF